MKVTELGFLATHVDAARGQRLHPEAAEWSEVQARQGLSRKRRRKLNQRQAVDAEGRSSVVCRGAYQVVGRAARGRQNQNLGVRRPRPEILRRAFQALVIGG